MTQIIFTIITILFGINVFKATELLKDAEKGDAIMMTILNTFIKENNKNNKEKEILINKINISIFLWSNLMIEKIDVNIIKVYNIYMKII